MQLSIIRWNGGWLGAGGACQANVRLNADSDPEISMASAQPPTSLNSRPTAEAEPSLISYPSLFPIKVMGLQADGLVHAVTSIARAFDPVFDASTVELRPSKGGKYLGITITVTATSREQLDELYRTLSTHPMVKVVL